MTWERGVVIKTAEEIEIMRKGPRRTSGTGRASSGPDGRLGDATARATRSMRPWAPTTRVRVTPRDARRERPRREADARDASAAGAAMDAARDMTTPGRAPGAYVWSAGGRRLEQKRVAQSLPGFFVLATDLSRGEL